MLLESNDRTTFELSDDAASLSPLLQDVGDWAPLPLMSTPEVALFVKFCSYRSTHPPCVIEGGSKHMMIPMPLPNKPFEDIVGHTYASMVDMDKAGLDSILRVELGPDGKLVGTGGWSKYMMLPHIQELVYAKVAHMMKGKTPAQLQAMFNVKCALSSESELREKFRKLL